MFLSVTGMPSFLIIGFLVSAIRTIRSADVLLPSHSRKERKH